MIFKRMLSILLVLLMAVSVCLPIAAQDETAQGTVSVTAMKSAAGTGRYIVTAKKLNVRAKPNASATIIGSIPIGSNVKIREISGSWGRILYCGQAGWISLDYAYKAAIGDLKLSAAGLNLIKSYEGFSAYAYWDNYQWTIGYGTQCKEGEYPNGITEAQAAQLLLEELAYHERYVHIFLIENRIPVTQKQFDALVSLTYNLGDLWHNSKYGDFELKTILINGAEKSNPDAIRSGFGRFCKAGGQVLPGLVKRRAAEAEMFISGTTFGYSTALFKDVRSTAWYYDSLKFCYYNGIINGSSDNTFMPNKALSRAMAVTLIGAVAGIDTSAYTTTPFKDVPANAWYAPYVAWASSKAIVNGTGNGHFSPNANITRQDMAVILYNYTTFLSGKPASNVNTCNRFSDWKTISQYARPAVAWAVEKGICAGNDKGQFNPKGATTRSAAASMMASYGKKIKGLS